jgi:hypothetical protein
MTTISFLTNDDGLCGTWSEVQMSEIIEDLRLTYFTTIHDIKRQSSPEYFYKNTSKKQLFEMVHSFAELLSDDDQSWLDKAKEELEILKQNQIV